jgi:hypothetical protein
MSMKALHAPVLMLALALALASPAAGQRGLSGRLYENMPMDQENLFPSGIGPGTRQAQFAAGVRPVIMLTGYWPPTNNMLRHFSTNPAQNPDGWKGSNWEGRGFDVYSYFPEFPAGLGQGVGDLEVDYQDTTNDFWPLANNLQPVAIITFSRAGIGERWEVEWNNRNLATWIDDYTAPLQPTPSPPDASVPAGTIRNSTLPVQDVKTAIRIANLPGIGAFIDFAGDGGGFLSEYIAYHGVWYQDLHSSPSDPAWCIAGGHVHVSSDINLSKATRAANQTVRAVARYVETVLDTHGGSTVWFCKSSDNSAPGGGSILTAIGSHSIMKNELTLSVVETVPNGFGLPFYGATNGTAVPFGDGQLCITGSLFRVLPATMAGPDGIAVVPLNLGAAPFSGGLGQVTAGSTWNFQYWLRDPANGATGFNASSGLKITFAP